MVKGFCGEIRNKIRFIQRIKFIKENEGTGLCDEAKILRSQIGELMKKIRIRISETKTNSKKQQAIKYP